MRHEVPILRASTVPREVLLVSLIHTCTGHWDTNSGGFRWCAKESCAYCRDGWRPEDRYLMRLEDEQQEPWLFEARSRLSSVVRELQSFLLQGRTAWLRLEKEGPRPNSPVRLDILRVVSHTQLYDILPLFKAMYLAPFECDRVESEAVFSLEEAARERIREQWRSGK